MSLLETLGNVCVLGFGKTGVSVRTYLLQRAVSSVTLVGGADATVGEDPSCRLRRTGTMRLRSG